MGERALPMPADGVWDAVSEAGTYAELAPGIAATQVVAGSGSGMVRECTGDHGGTWSETCTLWEEGRRHRMTVDVSSYPVYSWMLLHGCWEAGVASRDPRAQHILYEIHQLG